MKKTTVSLLLLLSAAAVGVAVPLACGDSTNQEPTEPPPGDPELRSQILDNLGRQIILPELKAFLAEAQELRTAIQSARETPEQTPVLAREAYETAFARWQTLEVMQLGPLAPMMSGDELGQDLRDRIYSWPLTNPCRVDQLIADGTYEDTTALAQEKVNAYGLDALGYLLFNESSDNSCLPTVAPNSNDAWNFEAQELAARRLAYAESAAALLVEAAQDAVDAYDPAAGGFVDDLAKAGESTSRFSSTQEAFNLWAQALFYLDTETKDMKVGGPLGLTCDLDTCEVESPFAELSKAAVEANVRSFDRQFFGGVRPDDGPGLDDLLDNINQSATAEDMAEALDRVYVALEALDGTLAESIETQPEAVQELFDALRVVNTLFKADTFGLLALELPDNETSDTD